MSSSSQISSYKELQEALAKRYQVVDEAGPGVMKVEVALLDAEAATPGVRSVTMVVPQLRLLSAGYALVAGRCPFSGGGLAAAKISDSVTDEILGDRRGSPGRGGVGWTRCPVAVGDVENAIKDLVLAACQRDVCIHLGREEAMTGWGAKFRRRWPGRDGRHTEPGAASRPDAEPQSRRTGSLPMMPSHGRTRSIQYIVGAV